MSSVTDASINPSTDSASEVKQFFDQYFSNPIQYSSNEVDSVVGFFTKRGFDQQASISVATTLLQQAKVEKKPVFQLLDTLKGLDSIQLSKLIAAILNSNRSYTSALGYVNNENVETTESRNIIV